MDLTLPVARLESRISKSYHRSFIVYVVFDSCAFLYYNLGVSLPWGFLRGWPLAKCPY